MPPFRTSTAGKGAARLQREGGGILSDTAPLSRSTNPRQRSVSVFASFVVGTNGR